MELLNKIIFNNTIKSYIIAFVLFFVLFFIFRFFRTIVLIKIKELTERSKNNFDDLLIDIFAGVSPIFYWITSFYLAIQSLFLPTFLSKTIYYFFVLIIVWELIQAAKTVIDFIISFFIKRNNDKKSVFRIFKIFAYIILYVIAFLTTLSFFGIDITAIVAGLGIGGIAIGFALKEILADLFSYFTILLDQPIKVGDYINIGGQAGSVKKIGIKTTRLVGSDGREIIVSNTAISSGLFDNSGTREYRRVKYVLGVSYDTPSKKLKKIKKAIEKIIGKEEKGEFLRSHFKSFGDSALEFTIDYKLLTTGYDEYADAKERINFGILEFCEKEKIEIAYPTMTIYTKK